MITLKADSLKRFVLDARKVESSVEKAERKVFSKFGLYVYRFARKSIRKRNKSSKPGKPPSSHQGSLRRLIRYAYDAGERSLVVGPMLFRGRKSPHGDGAPIPPAETTPEVLEYGGRVKIVEYQRLYTPHGRRVVEGMGKDPDAWYRIGRKRLWHKKGQPLRIRRMRRRSITIEPRPFMHPAFEEKKPELDKLWLDSVT